MASDDPHGVITLQGDGSIDQVLRRAVTRIDALGLDVYAVIDHSGDAAEAGVALLETKLVLLGSPRDSPSSCAPIPGLRSSFPSSC